MKSNTFLGKLFLGSVLWTIGFSSLAFFSGAQAFEQDPQLANKISNKYNVQIAMSRWQNNFDSSNAARENRRFEKSFALPSSRITIDVINGDLSIQPSNGSEIEIIASGNPLSSYGGELLEIVHNETEALIKQPKKSNIDDLKVSIKIPKDFNKAISVTTVSGDLDLEDMKFDYSDIRTVSGDVHLRRVAAQTLKINSVSGDIESEALTTKSIDGESVSGDIELKLSDVADIQVKSVSGDLKFKLPKASQFQVDFKTTSGRIEQKLIGTDGADHRIRAMSTSGDIKIEPSL